MRSFSVKRGFHEGTQPAKMPKSKAMNAILGTLVLMSRVLSLCRAFIQLIPRPRRGVSGDGPNEEAFNLTPTDLNSLGAIEDIVSAQLAQRAHANQNRNGAGDADA